jgi:hypothetical protein
MFTTKNSEKDEVSNIRFIRLSDIGMYQWAFNHETLINEIVK